MKTTGLTMMILLVMLQCGFSQEEKNDTTRIKIGNSTILVIGPDTKDYEVVADTDDEKFNGHFAGLDLGLNTYLNSSYNMNLNPEDRYLELNTGKSWGVGVNFLEKNISFGGNNNAGIVTGLGFEINNYRFNNDILLMHDSSRIYAYDSTGFDKSKLVATYLTIPIIFEFQIPAGKKDRKFHFAVGGTGGLKIGSHTKYAYEINNSMHKDKVREDFHLSPFRYGITARIGYMGINIFANYSLSTLFENNEGPELYPFTVGLSLVGF
ncbi:MAG: PorT family protein [Bacteroidota bacterium]